MPKSYKKLFEIQNNLIPIAIGSYVFQTRNLLSQYLFIFLVIRNLLNLKQHNSFSLKQTIYFLSGVKSNDIEFIQNLL